MANELRVSASVTAGASSTNVASTPDKTLAHNAASDQIITRLADAKASAALAIDPLPVFHAPVKINLEEHANNLKLAIEHINTVLKDGGRGLNFAIDDTLNSPIVKVVRADTGEVIRQFPNEAVVRVAHNIEKLKGVLFQELI
jgi:uncharacterized FlaG/YvyC family protein